MDENYNIFIIKTKHKIKEVISEKQSGKTTTSEDVTIIGRKKLLLNKQKINYFFYKYYNAIFWN